MGEGTIRVSWGQYCRLAPSYGSYGATPMSTVINAEANFLVGLGAAEVGRSIARINDAKATEQEIINRQNWVRSYFEI